ncbi:MAG TPA: group II intron reverse transcriptase/maturase, partial [Firmicutes bacterium]|nr:group II intron reverse transcriptase/maturase [Bacillota bacterium]
MESFGQYEGESRLDIDPTTEDPVIPMELGPAWLERKQRVLPEKLTTLRRKLYRKAKQEPEFRFYALYDRIYRKDVLWSAWEQVRANGGAAGPDGVTIDQIVTREGGAERLVEGLHESLRTRTYRPGRIRRVWIPKSDGRRRPLGIPNVVDRVAQMAALLVLEPIFEADFEDCSHGFRPGRGAHDAVQAVAGHLKSGRREVYDADLQGYFDSIPHDKLESALRVRITDGSVLKLIRMWLRAEVEDNSDGGGPRRYRPRAGTPQGGVLSPLLANAFLHWLDRAFHGSGGPANWASAKLVRYADDFVIVARYVGPRLVNWVERITEHRLGLTLNRDKTRIVNLTQPGSSLDFLGYTFRYDRDLHGGTHRYLHVGPSAASLGRARDRLRELTAPKYCFLPLPTLIGRINRYLGGWRNYFGQGYPRRAYRHLNQHARKRLACHLRRRSQR